MGRLVWHEEIIRLVSKLREVSDQIFTERFGVSEVTIRKDLTLLEEAIALDPGYPSAYGQFRSDLLGEIRHSVWLPIQCIRYFKPV